MSEQSVWLVRHGETPWSRDRRHTSVSEVPLTPAGVAAAEEIGRRLRGRAFSLVLTSPRVRARHTAELAGHPDAEVDEDLSEWSYGEYEGMTTEQIRMEVPGWTVWTHPAPRGEPAGAISTRVDRVIARARAANGDVLIFGHGHALRALAARWLGQPVADGRFYRLDTGTISVLGHERETPVIERWNS